MRKDESRWMDHEASQPRPLSRGRNPTAGPADGQREAFRRRARPADNEAVARLLLRHSICQDTGPGVRSVCLVGVGSQPVVIKLQQQRLYPPTPLQPPVLQDHLERLGGLVVKASALTTAVVGCLLNVPATCQRISGADL